MKILITGGCGFIGSNFIRHILKNHPTYKVINYDNLTYAGNLDSLKDVEVNPNYRFVKGDIADAKRVGEVIETFSIGHIVNFAAETHVDRSILGPQEFIRTNVVGTQVLLDSALKNNIKRFHHISTDEVFGALPLNTNDKFDETTRYDPKSPYSASKAASDHLVRSYHTTYGLPVTITNSSNNYGPYMNPEKFLSRSITNLIDGQKIPIYGDGKYVRDWLYVEDHCRAIDMILQKPSLGDKGATFLLGGQSQDLNNLEVAKKVLKAFGKNEKYINHVKDRPGHDRRYAVNWEKAKKELGWKPKYDFDTWIERTIEWYKTNEWWWRPLKDKAEDLYEKTGQK